MILKIEEIDVNCFNVFFEQDGAVVVDQCYNTEDFQRFKFNEITDMLKESPSLATADISNYGKQKEFDASPEAYKEGVCKNIDALLYSDRLEKGFLHNGNTFQTDAIAQQNANGYLSALAAGVPVLPITWRTQNNVNVTFITAEEFMLFAGTMLQYIQIQFQATWNAKDAVRSATTFEEVTSIYEAYAS